MMLVLLILAVLGISCLISSILLQHCPGGIPVSLRSRNPSLLLSPVLSGPLDDSNFVSKKPWGAGKLHATRLTAPHSICANYLEFCLDLMIPYVSPICTHAHSYTRMHVQSFMVLGAMVLTNIVVAVLLGALALPTLPANNAPDHSARA